MSDEAELKRNQIGQALTCGPTAQLANLASLGRGFANSDVGFGVLYPSEIHGDERPVPPGFVQVYGFWGEEFEFLIEEREYLMVLAKWLRARGLASEAVKVESLFN